MIRKGVYNKQVILCVLVDRYVRIAKKKTMPLLTVDMDYNIYLPLARYAPVISKDTNTGSNRYLLTKIMSVASIAANRISIAAILNKVISVFIYIYIRLVITLSNICKIIERKKKYHRC